MEIYDGRLITDSEGIDDLEFMSFVLNNLSEENQFLKKPPFLKVAVYSEMKQRFLRIVGNSS